MTKACSLALLYTENPVFHTHTRTHTELSFFPADWCGWRQSGEVRGQEPGS